MRPPKVYSIDEHRIPHNKIDSHAYYVIEKLRKAGFISFLVGGSVRDLLLGARPKDFDISTSAKPEEVKKLFRNCILIGRRFRLAHIRFGRKILEVSTFRAGDAEKDSIILQDNIFGSPEQDVLRRDFTINGLFYDPEVQTIIDYVEGFDDIEKKTLRTIGKSELRFIQDPVRMIRLLKFKARFDLDIEKNTLEGLIKCKDEITKSSPARVLEELLRMLESGSSKRFFQLLSEYSFLELLLNNLALFLKKDKNNEIYDLLDQADIFVAKNHPKKIDRAVLISCLIFPMLDAKLKKINDEKIHLGIIFETAKNTIDEVFKGFVHIPRRIKAAMVTILSNQYRFTPLIKIKRKRFKIPRDPFFYLAMTFFNLRCMQNPDLYKIYTSWNEAIMQTPRRKKYKAIQND